MTQIIHHSKRNERLIADGRLDGSAAWSEAFNGTPGEAEASIRDRYGRAARVDKSSRSTDSRFHGFTLTVLR
jgi:hypothetical protein